MALAKFDASCRAQFMFCKFDLVSYVQYIWFVRFGLTPMKKMGLIDLDWFIGFGSQLNLSN